MRKFTTCRIMATFVLMTVAISGQARAQRNPETTVQRSLEVLSEITRNPKTGMPRLVMRNAHAFAIIPEMFKASFIFGARFGRGILVVRQPDGTWSNPLFIHLMGGSFGFQAGAQSTDLVLVFQSRRGLDRFLKGKGKLTLGVDVGAAAGPVGKRFEASTDAALKSEILSYSNTHGIFAGVSAEGGTLQLDWKANALYYDRPVSAGEILAINSMLAVPPSTVTLKQMLAEKTALPERLARSRRGTQGPIIIEEGPASTIDRGDAFEIDDRIDEPRPSATRSGAKPAPARRQPRPEARPLIDEDLDAIPDPAPLKDRPSQKPRPPVTNDEDMPEPASRPAAKDSRVKPEPRPKDVDDDLPDLEAPN